MLTPGHNALPPRLVSAGETKPYLTTVKTARVTGSGTPDSLVFLTEQGTPYRAENVERTLDKYLVAVGLPRLSPHGLWHSWNNLARAVGTDAETCAALAGHLPSVNVDVYSHASDAEKRKAAELVARLIPA